MLHAVIMAGGSGTRFWPESRAAWPKQLLPLSGTRSLIQDTVDRLGQLVPPERILIVTAARLVEAVRGQLPELPAAAVIGEPCKRDTAPCIGLAAFRISRGDSDATLAVMPADHAILPAQALRDAIHCAADLVDRQPERIVTFGIKATYPAESFGYIERGEPVELPVEPASGAACLAFEVARFKEKPPAAVAREYLASGNFYWNSGIFVWKARTILAALEQHQSELFGRLRAIAAADGTSEFQATFEREFAAIRGISIDYAIMERAPDVVVIEAPFTWDDVGSWQAMARLRGVDTQNNTIAADPHIAVNTSGTILRSVDRHLIAAVGLKDMIVVHTPDATLVASRHDEEAIRQVVKQLEERGWTEYL
ncbi:MAG TPA: mannose-1-phosphate guanylyltransferase [Pirellulales bacterium]|jgi:mannose-1-phosphate guanylyltransferase|nr:mannose-1-phosphate guanylyltransferase [Pirellulales bacterium]